MFEQTADDENREFPSSAILRMAQEGLMRRLGRAGGSNERLQDTLGAYNGDETADFSGPFLDALTMGMWNEMKAGARAAGDAIDGRSFSESYRQHVDAQRDGLDRYRKGNPLAARLAEMAGSSVGSFIPGIRILQAGRYVPEVIAGGEDVLRGLLAGLSDPDGEGSRLLRSAADGVQGRLQGAADNLTAPFGFRLVRR